MNTRFAMLAAACLALKCRDFGYQPQTKPYADCRIELERLRAGARPVTVSVQ